MSIKQIKATEQFIFWLDGLKDVQGRARIQARIQSLAAGNHCVYRNLKLGVSELKIDVGPGYRVYYTQRHNVLIILLCGGDKASQRADIDLAYQLVNNLEV